ncbi:MAG: aminotransferase class I/II-fold pyridoxal phosphate-dependent enzyme [Campylobacterales bacterium]|nr:aminotransferase class I/II-fold pyridoxal phosphate-dependent enzyme [Campylobacterales bacterium]
MEKNKIFLSPPHMGGNELKYIEEVFKSNYIAPLGEYVNKFEKAITEYTGAKYAVALSTATAGIQLALKVLGIQENDEVLASDFTFIGSVAGITYLGGKPIFIDSDLKSWNLDPKLLQSFINDRKARNLSLPKALVLTHLYGQMADIESIVKICKENNIFLIEDAAESLGATFNGKQSGTFGDIGVYSFNGNKILTTSGGGIVVTDNKKWADKITYYATTAREEELHYEHLEVGYNYRMSNVLAAIGTGQMEVLNERVQRKREIFNLYKSELKDLPVGFMEELPNTYGNRWLTTFYIKDSSTTPTKVIDKLQNSNIESRPLWKPMSLQKAFKNSQVHSNSIGKKLFKSGICIPSGTSLEDKEIKYISDLIKECFRV